MTDEQTIRDVLVSHAEEYPVTGEAALAALDRLVAERDTAYATCRLLQRRLEDTERQWNLEVARAEAAEGNAAEWKERLELTLDACPSCGGSGIREVPEREQCGACDGSGEVSAAWMYERVEAAEKERDEAQALLHDSNTAYLTLSGQFARAANARDAAEARCATLEAALRRIIENAEAQATQPAEEEVVAAASVLGLSREETDELVRLARSEGATTTPAEKEGT